MYITSKNVNVVYIIIIIQISLPIFYTEWFLEACLYSNTTCQRVLNYCCVDNFDIKLLARACVDTASLYFDIFIKPY